MFTQTLNVVSATSASAESAGMSELRLQLIEDHLKRNYIDNGRFPCTHTLVYRHGKMVHSAAQGWADVERQALIKDDTIFRIYSMTKPITSVAFMMLVEEGRVGLDEQVAKYISEWRDLAVYFGGMPMLGPQPMARQSLSRERPRGRCRLSIYCGTRRASLTGFKTVPM